MKMEVVSPDNKKKIVPKKKPAAKTKAVATTKKKEIAVQSDPGTLLKLAIENGLSVEQIGQLIDMKVREEERQCKKNFDFHFSLMQKEFSPIVRTKKGDKSDYAPVDALVKQYGPIIANHNFSFSWDEVPQEDKSLKVVLTISGYGHDKINSKLLPVYIPDKGSQSGKFIMNSLQAEGTRSTYGYRYTFKAGFGLTETDEDTDGNLFFSDAVNYADQITWLKTCNTKKDLLDIFRRIVEDLKKSNDTIGKGVITKVYTDIKGELIE